MDTQRLTADDLPRLRQFWIEHWGGEEMISRGNIYHPEQLDGFVIEDRNEWIGLLTFFIKDDECEVTSLDSLREGQGIGSKLIDQAIEEARARGCKRLFLITTNDNLNALGFYQKRGFEIVAIYRGAINESRKIKPSISLIGMNNIPLRDEIELEIKFVGARYIVPLHNTMYLKHLSLTNFRNFTRLDVDIPRRVVLLVGNNAQGKTSVLEAIYFLAAFTSFQTHADRQIVNFTEAKNNSLTVTRLVAEYKRGNGKHRLEARLILEPTGVVNGQRLRKEVLLDGVKKPVNEVIGHFNAVIFVPQMSQIIEGAPEDRRRYLNLALAQSTPMYARVLSEYSQALTQRNALLKLLSERGSILSAAKGGGSGDQLEVWDETLTRLGAQIILWRIEAVQQIERLASRVHNELTHGSEILRLAYEPAFDPLPKPNGQLGLKINTVVDRSGLELKGIQTGFRERLRDLRNEEIARGVTTIGPHRDELRFLANDIDLGNYGSRGQVRTTLLALKLAEVNWMKERTGEWPVILLDEVMAELDLQRRADLLKYVGESEQVLFTTTDLNLFTPEFKEKAEVWRVESGRVEK